MFQFAEMFHPWLFRRLAAPASFSLTASVTNSRSGIPRPAAADFARRKIASGISKVVFMFFYAPIFMGGGQSGQSSVSFLHKLRTAAGRRVRSWGSKGTGPGRIQIPHSLATDGKTLCVADRTNARTPRFNLDGSYLAAGLLRSRSRAARRGSQS